jgi:hypothetical protein
MKPGKVSWVHGTKLEFFRSHKDEFLAAAEIEDTRAFYGRVSQLYLEKYSYNTAWDGDLEEGEEVTDDIDPDEDIDNLPAEEGERRAEYFKTLRTVSFHFDV